MVAMENAESQQVSADSDAAWHHPSALHVIDVDDGMETFSAQLQIANQGATPAKPACASNAREDERSKHPQEASNPGKAAESGGNTTISGSQGNHSDDAVTNEGLFGFSDPDTIKKRVRAALHESSPYDVRNFYKTEGIAQQLARSSWFETITLMVIAANGAYIAIDTDWNKEKPMTSSESNSVLQSSPTFMALENLFCAYFFWEWLVRCSAFQVKSNGLKDFWFVFDSGLLLLMVSETWILSIVISVAASSDSAFDMGNVQSSIPALRLVRLLRLSRLTRVLRSFPELMILVKGMATAMRSVTYVMGLLFIVTYIFGIAFAQMAVGTPTLGPDFFPNVPHAMYSLLIHATLLDDLASLMEVLRTEFWPLLVLALVFIGVSALTVMNMLIGILCEVVSAVATTEKEESLARMVSEKLAVVALQYDDDGNRLVSYDEFTKILTSPEAIKSFEMLGVNPITLLDMAELIFADDEVGNSRKSQSSAQIEFGDLMEIILDLRESKTATVKDMMRLWLQIKASTNAELKLVSKKVDGLERQLGSTTSRIESQLAELIHEVRSLRDPAQANATAIRPMTANVLH